MSKTEQALLLDPPTELHFKAPFHDVTTSYLNLTNPTNRQICFKVKTTAPKTYCVRPNSGIVEPLGTVPVAVMLQPLDLETADRSKHKFMVQSMFAPDGDFNPDALWRDVLPEGLMNSKLKCVFDIPHDSSSQQVVADVVDPPKVETKAAVVQQEVPAAKTAADTCADIKKQLQKTKNLQKELNELRQENSSLKEECLRFRVAYDSRSKGTSAQPSEIESSVSPANQQIGIPTYLIVLSVVIFLIGIFLGRLL
ncbi:vesicle-associated membrane protein-associated protein B/C-like [Uloborus diversus]|uniref:vesicle-associated membrane protein-associated protein B/C-like n=1 Tax=Uloborus diversus TaxID=327109 RepID=UPI00240A4E4F|nr:vesicle-associated membrane protein-associated protein B/C-like [Uloborus diversus]